MDYHALTGRNISEADAQALQWMAEIAERKADEGCYMPTPCNPEQPDCRPCRARHALQKLERLIEFECRTRHPERLISEAERIYFDEWMKANQRHPAINHGTRLLENVLNPDLSKPAPPVPQHDAEIATTLIQWLGTSCGRSFIDQCEERIRKEKASRYSRLRALEVRRYVEMHLPPSPEQDHLRQTAEIIAGKYQSIQTRWPDNNLADDIYAALLEVRQQHEPAPRPLPLVNTPPFKVGDLVEWTDEEKETNQYLVLELSGDGIARLDDGTGGFWVGTDELKPTTDHCAAWLQYATLLGFGPKHIAALRCGVSDGTQQGDELCVGMTYPEKSLQWAYDLGTYLGHCLNSAPLRSELSN